MEDDNSLLNIALSSSDESTAAPQKAPRDYQSEEAFQEVKATWKPKIESGEVNSFICSSFFLMYIYNTILLTTY
jgi:hypothetical protein